MRHCIVAARRRLFRKVHQALGGELRLVMCSAAHLSPALQRSWERTRHGFTWRKLLDGELVTERGPAAESCATCHSLGYDRSVVSGGYDDIADLFSITFPGPTP